MTMVDEAKVGLNHHMHLAANWNIAANVAPSTAKMILCMGQSQHHRREMQRISDQLEREGQ